MTTLTNLVTDRGDGLFEDAPTWKVVATLILSLMGLAVSVYLTYAHFAGVQSLSCPGAGSVINCEKVTTSAQSYFLKMPVAVLGLGYYVVYTALNTPWAWRASDRRVHLARLAVAVLGMAFALYLVSAELLIIGNICLWCTSVHIITFFLFVLVISTVPAMLGWGVHGATDDA
ncbi:MAG TPA: vitamin K epoxide reductase family protein [Acidimicrobiales bacterium]|nr:vitamin K epoxide reductase family protein [Acidimicrobiales bacterium]